MMTVAVKNPRNALLSHTISPFLTESLLTAGVAIEQSPRSSAYWRVTPFNPPESGVTHFLFRKKYTFVIDPSMI
jgi:hypothetical protein